MIEEPLPLSDAIARVLQNSYFTVKNGHAWTREDHASLEAVLRRATRAYARDWIDALGVTFYLALLVADRGGAVAPLGAALALEDAKQFYPDDVPWTPMAENLKPVVAYGRLPEPYASTAHAEILEIKLGGSAKTDGYTYG